MCVTICGRFCPDEGAVAGYGNRIQTKYTAKWGVQIAGMIFQTGSKAYFLNTIIRNSAYLREVCYNKRTCFKMNYTSQNRPQNTVGYAKWLAKTGG